MSLARRAASSLVLLALLAIGLVALPPAADAQLPAPLSDRIVPEPMERLLYLSFAEHNAFLDDLAERYGDRITTDSIGMSEEGREMVTYELTDPDSPVPYDDRPVVYLSTNIHPNEPGGREGGIRWAEDMLIAHEAGDPFAVRALQQLRILQVNTNPDGWAQGDADNLSLDRYTRENADGVDLNRQSPWPGFIPTNRQPVSTAESKAWVADIQARKAAGQTIAATADVHGMIQDEAAVWTLLSSGQFDLGSWVKQREMGELIGERVTERIGELPIFATPEFVPHRLTSSSEFKGGLSGSGFFGDYLAQRQGLGGDSISTIELFFNNGPAGAFDQTTYQAPLVQIHVDSMRGIFDAIVETALVDRDVVLDVPGAVGVVADPRVVTVDVTDPLTGRVIGTDAATTMAFFDELDPFLPQPTRRLSPAGVTSTALSELSTLVVHTDAGLAAPATAAIADFVRGGGTLVLTDAGMKVLEGVAPGVPAGAVTVTTTPIGNATFTDFEHPLAEGLRDSRFERTLHTYEPSTLGYNSDGPSQAPVWRVDRAQFEAAGGVTVATTGGGTSIGQLEVGAGSIRLIGGLLAPPTDAGNPRFGLSSYALNDTGTFVFANALGGEIVVTERLLGDEATVPDEEAGEGAEGEVEGGEPATPQVVRISGDERVATAAAVSAEAFDTARTAVLAQAGDYPDALAGAPLAAAVAGPLLLTDGDVLSASTASELQRLGVEDVLVLGGEQAVGPGVVAALVAIGIDVERIAGPERFATAAQIADRLRDERSAVEEVSSGRVFIAAGSAAPDASDPASQGWPDALSAAPLAAFAGDPVLLTARDGLPQATLQALAELGITEVVIVGGTAVVGDAVADELAERGHGPRRLAGATRYETSRLVADEAVAAGVEGARLWLATGRAFPDALGAGPAAAAAGDLLLLIDPVVLDDAPPTAELVADGVTLVRLLGGPSAISGAVEDTVRQRIGAEPR